MKTKKALQLLSFLQGVVLWHVWGGKNNGFLFLPHFDIICDLLLNRCTGMWNLFVKQIQPSKKKFLPFLFWNRATAFETCTLSVSHLIIGVLFLCYILMAFPIIGIFWYPSKAWWPWNSKYKFYYKIASRVKSSSLFMSSVCSIILWMHTEGQWSLNWNAGL